MPVEGANLKESVESESTLSPNLQQVIPDVADSGALGAWDVLASQWPEVKFPRHFRHNGNTCDKRHNSFGFHLYRSSERVGRLESRGRLGRRDGRTGRANTLYSRAQAVIGSQRFGLLLKFGGRASGIGSNSEIT